MGPSRTGVVRCAPRSLCSFQFSESIEIGRTTLSFFEVLNAALSLSQEWPASSYHVTRRNCISFAQALVERLGLELAFPDWVRNSWNLATSTPQIASFFDNSMEFIKWQNKPNSVPSTSNKEFCICKQGMRRPRECFLSTCGGWESFLAKTGEELSFGSRAGLENDALVTHTSDEFFEIPDEFFDI